MIYPGKDILFVDFETFYDSKAGYGLRDLSVTEYIRDPRFRAHGLAYSWLHEGVTHWITIDHVIDSWLNSINWANTVVVAHNVRFDGSILAWRYGVKPHAWFDTIALAKAVLGEQVPGYSLKSLAEALGLPAKGELKADGLHTLSAAQMAELAAYCKNDTDICKGIYEKLIKDFPASQCASMDWTIRAFIEPRLRLDIPTLEKGIKAEKERREKAIQDSGVEKEILSSNAKFAALLERRGYVVPTKISGRTGKKIPAFAKTDAGLERLSVEDPTLYAARIASKANLLETRGQSLLAVAKTGSFPFDIGFSGAVQTHRYSGADGAGGNPQNFTRKSYLRDAVCAPSGSSLIVGDFAAIELRILSWLAKEPKLINAIINERDVYSEFASTYYGRPVPAKKSTPERHFGKCAILGLGYGMGGKKFMVTVKTQLKQDITEGAAFSTVKLYRTTYFNVPKLWEACGSLIPLMAADRIGCLYFAPFIKVKKNALILPSGLTIQYPNLRQEDGEWVYDKWVTKTKKEPMKLYGGKMVENICQGLAGELCKEAITRAESCGLTCVGAVHDEIIAVSTDGVKQKAILQECMEKSPNWWPQIKLKAEVGSGENWNVAK